MEILLILLKKVHIANCKSLYRIVLLIDFYSVVATNDPNKSEWYTCYSSLNTFVIYALNLLDFIKKKS